MLFRLIDVVKFSELVESGKELNEAKLLSTTRIVPAIPAILPKNHLIESCSIEQIIKTLEQVSLEIDLQYAVN